MHFKARLDTTIFSSDCHPDVCDSLTIVQRAFYNTYQRFINKNYVAYIQSHTSE